MKLATLKDGSRDGQLLVVSRDLRSAVIADGIAPNLQRVLDDWNFHAPQLGELYTSLNRGEARRAFVLDPAECMAPLPRAYRCVGMADRRVAGATGLPTPGKAEPRQSDKARPRLSEAAGTRPPGQADSCPSATGMGGFAPMLEDQAGDDHAGPRDALLCPADAAGIEVQPGLAVITGELPQGAGPAQALAAVLLVVLASDALVRQAPRADQLTGDRHTGLLARAFAPAAVSVDELGPAWREGRLHCRIVGSRDGEPLAHAWTQAGDGYGFGEALARLARTRPVRAGTVVAMHCLADPLPAGAPFAGQLGFDARDEHDRSIFGATDQPLGSAAPSDA